MGAGILLFLQDTCCYANAVHAGAAGRWKETWNGHSKLKIKVVQSESVSSFLFFSLYKKKKKKGDGAREQMRPPSSWAMSRKQESGDVMWGVSKDHSSILNGSSTKKKRKNTPFTELPRRPYVNTWVYAYTYLKKKKKKKLWECCFYKDLIRLQM